MKIAIIGAGNMGGAIARGLAQGSIVSPRDITVANPSQGKLDRLKAEYPDMCVTTDNAEAVRAADMVLFAVKPWLIEPVMKELAISEAQVVLSVAAGISFETLQQYTKAKTLFRVIPNTAIAERVSMTLIASHHASREQERLLLDMFSEMGLAMLVPESQLAAATSLASCGIAYALKYIQAAMQAGVEMGIRPGEAMKMAAQSVKGAAELILNNDTHPSVEIDKVTTPGGITIKGINELEHAGFTSAVIQAMKTSR